MLYEIVNPSDAYTIVAKSFDVAAVACFVLGKGRYAFKPIDDDKAPEVPIFLFGGADEWCREQFGVDAGDLVQGTLKDKRDELAECLDSCLIGNASDRKDFDEACAAISDPVKQTQFRESRHDRRRSSMNDIGGRAYRIAAKIRQNKAA